MDSVDTLREAVTQRERELADLRARLAAAEAAAETAATAAAAAATATPAETVLEEPAAAETAPSWQWPLEDHEYERYGRQMVVPGFGLEAQLRLKSCRVLLVGAGGLGCPAAAYLAGAGVGTLGLVDADEVEVSNLHRQVAHATARVGTSKVLSAVAYLRELNPAVAYQTHQEHLTPANARAIVSQYDVVLDCTDRPASRYLVSDACVLLAKPLVSASAFQTSGQLVVLNSPPGTGPCYRCLFPRPPPPETVVGCGEGGILGPVVGTMGVLQALEAIKLVCADEGRGREPRLLLFSAMGSDGPSFRSVRMRGRRDDCVACSGKLTLAALESSLDYAHFCGVVEPVRLLAPHERVSPAQYRQLRATQPAHVLVDVRPPEHFSMGSIPGAVNVPMSRLSRGESVPELEAAGRDLPIYLVCRVGNDSQVAVRMLRERRLDAGGRFIGDMAGGIKAWKDSVDGTLPFL